MSAWEVVPNTPVVALPPPVVPEVFPWGYDPAELLADDDGVFDDNEEEEDG